MKNTTSTTKASEKNSAQTPRWFFNSLESYLGVQFDLDVCANVETTKCGNYFSLDEHGVDSLSTHWRERNFCNPPFDNISAWIKKSIADAKLGNSTAMIFPDTPETGYSRLAFDHADTIIKMPFRLRFLRPDGTEFLDKHGKKQGPQFPCVVAWFTPLGLKVPTRTVYHDFRIGYKDRM
jgi:hypothetical protein